MEPLPTFLFVVLIDIYQHLRGVSLCAQGKNKKQTLLLIESKNTQFWSQVCAGWGKEK